MTFQNASPNGYSIILILGSIITIGFFIGFMIILLKKSLKIESKIFTIIVFDVYGNQTELPGIRINFKNHDVASSFANFYKKEFPLYNFSVEYGNNLQRHLIIK